MIIVFFLFSSRRRHTRCALVTGVQTCALPISAIALIATPAVAQTNERHYASVHFGGITATNPSTDPNLLFGIFPVLPSDQDLAEAGVALGLGTRYRAQADAPSDSETATPTVNVVFRSEEHTSELQSLMRISYAVFCLKKQKQKINTGNISYIQ